MSTFLIVWGCAAGCVALGWIYFRHCHISRPAIGVFNLSDVVVVVCAVVLVPYFYLALPPLLAASVLGIAFLSILHTTAQPVFPIRWQAWLVVVVMVSADVGAAVLQGTTSASFLAIDDSVVLAGVVGAANLWAQSGMKARDVAALAAVVTVYDFVATAQLPLMADLIYRQSTVPFAPSLAWGIGVEGPWLSIGLGDLLFATLFPLVMRKAFSQSAGLLALVLGIGAVGAMLALPFFGVNGLTLPAMVLLGPVALLQYFYWSRRHGQERTTWQYLAAEPMNG